jgi:hypothetical protein
MMRSARNRTGLGVPTFPNRSFTARLGKASQGVEKTTRRFFSPNGQPAREPSRWASTIQRQPFASHGAAITPRETRGIELVSDDFQIFLRRMMPEAANFLHANTTMIEIRAIPRGAF